VALTITNKNEKVVLHSWGRFRAPVTEAVVTGDLLALLGTEANDALQFANAGGTPQYAMAVACQNGAADETIWCCLAAELKAPVSVGAGGAVTPSYFAASSDYVGAALYLSDTDGKADESAGTATQQVGYIIARDRILLIPMHMLTGTTFTFSGNGTIGGTLGVTGNTTLGGTLTQTGVATFTAQDVHSAGLTCAAGKPMIGGILTTPKITATAKTTATGYTLTAAELTGGLIVDASATGGSSVALPTVAATVALLAGYVVGTSFLFIYKNTGTQTLTLATDASTQWTMEGLATVVTKTTGIWLMRITSATAGTAYRVGAGTTTA